MRMTMGVAAIIVVTGQQSTVGLNVVDVRILGVLCNDVPGVDKAWDKA